MKFAEDHNASNYKITAYESNGVSINGRLHEQSFILSPTTLITDWQPQSLPELKIEHLEAFYELKADVILLGTGEKQIFPDREILKFLVQNRIGYEIMDTQAACRTFNIIMAEDRNVVTGIFV